MSISKGRVDDFSFFDCSSPFCFLLIEFHCTFSISYKISYFVYYYFILIDVFDVFWGTGTRETEVGLDGWCEGSLRQQRNDCGGCATKRERVESPGTYVTE